MECGHLVSACHGSVDFHRTKGAVITTGLRLKRKRRVGCRGGAPRLRITATSVLPETPGSARRGSYQEPRRLLRTLDPNFQGLNPFDAPSTSGREDSSSGSPEADYTVQLVTSNENQSSLTLPNAGVLLSLIGEGGEALVRRVPPVRESADDASFRFQQGGVDAVQFRGPDLGRISALWIAPEAGTWRLAQVTVTVTPCEHHHEDTKRGRIHTFDAGDILLGDGEDSPAAELKPNGPEDGDPSLVVAAKTPQESAKLRDASMQEYAFLKLFLLGSTGGMVGVGTLGLFLLGAPDLAQGFAAGGVAGLVYLLLIQRAVDQLPSEENPNSKVKAPAASFALFVGLALVVTRAAQASTVVSLPPRLLLAGVVGFFVSKVAVLLAAFRSSSTGSESDPL